MTTPTNNPTVGDPPNQEPAFLGHPPPPPQQNFQLDHFVMPGTAPTQPPPTFATPEEAATAFATAIQTHVTALPPMGLPNTYQPTADPATWFTAGQLGLCLLQHSKALTIIYSLGQQDTKILAVILYPHPPTLLQISTPTLTQVTIVPATVTNRRTARTTDFPPQGIQGPAQTAHRLFPCLPTWITDLAPQTPDIKAIYLQVKDWPEVHNTTSTHPNRLLFAWLEIASTATSENTDQSCLALPTDPLPFSTLQTINLYWQLR